MNMLRHNREVVRCLLVALLMLAALPSPGRAVAPDEVLPDATMEARARALSQKLRCVVCQNQSIDDSTAPLARDLRILVRDRLKGGDSDADALKFIVARYGNFVLLQPPFQSNTLLLWLGPALLLILTAAGFASLFRRNGQDATEQQQKSMQFSTAEKKRLDAIFSEGRPT